MRSLTQFIVLLSINLMAAGSILGSQPIFATEWEVAKGVEQIRFPASPSAGAKGLIVLKVHINTAGAVTSAKMQSGERHLAAVVEPAMLEWHYNPFRYAGELVDVDAYVSVVYEPTETRYYVQGDHCALYGPPGTRATVREMKTDPYDTESSGRITVPPDDDPMWLQKRGDATHGVIAGKPKHMEQPSYPDAAQRAGVSGDVAVGVVVNKVGRVVYAAPLKGDALLLAASVAAARKWEFTTTTQNSKAVIVRAGVSFHFQR